MLFRGIVKKYTAGLILLTNFKKTICVQEGAVVDIFVCNFTFYDGFKVNRTFEGLSFEF